MIQNKMVITCDRCKQTNEQEITKPQPPRFFYESGAKFDLCSNCQEKFKLFMQNQQLEEHKTEVQSETIEPIKVDGYITEAEFDSIRIKIDDVRAGFQEALPTSDYVVNLSLDLAEKLFAEAASARVVRGRALTIWMMLSQRSESQTPIDRLLTAQQESAMIASWESHFPNGPNQWLSEVVQFEIPSSGTISEIPTQSTRPDNPTVMPKYYGKL